MNTTIISTSKRILTSLFAVLCFFGAASAQASQTLEVVSSLPNGGERVSCILISPADNFVRVAMGEGSCTVAGRILESAPGILISPADNRVELPSGILISPADNRIGDMFPGILISPADNRSCSRGIVVGTDGILISPADNATCPTSGILISPADNAVEVVEAAE